AVAGRACCRAIGRDERFEGLAAIATFVLKQRHISHLGYRHRRRTQDLVANRITVTNDSDDAPVVLWGRCWNSTDRFVFQRIELRAVAVDAFDAERLELRKKLAAHHVNTL